MASSNWSGRKVTSARAKLAPTLPRPCYRCSVMLPSAAECKELGIKWDVEHTISRVEGGTDDLSSLAVSHSVCNRSHGGKLGNARKAQAKVVRAVETERTHKFWNLATLFEFSSGSLKALTPSPTFFVSVAASNE